MSRCLLEDTMIYKAKGLFEFLVIDTTLHQYMIDHLSCINTTEKFRLEWDPNPQLL